MDPPRRPLLWSGTYPKIADFKLPSSGYSFARELPMRLAGDGSAALSGGAFLRPDRPGAGERHPEPDRIADARREQRRGLDIEPQAGRVHHHRLSRSAKNRAFDPPG